MQALGQPRQRLYVALITLCAGLWAPTVAQAVEFVFTPPIRVERANLPAPLYVKVLGEEMAESVNSGVRNQRPDVARFSEALSAILQGDEALARRYVTGPPERLTDEGLAASLEKSRARYSRYAFFVVTHMFKLGKERVFVVDAREQLAPEGDTFTFVMTEADDGSLMIPLGYKPSDLVALLTRAVRLAARDPRRFLFEPLADFNAKRRGGPPLVEVAVGQPDGNRYAILIEEPSNATRDDVNAWYERFLSIADQLGVKGVTGLVDERSADRLTRNLSSTGGEANSDFFKENFGGAVRQVWRNASPIEIAFLQTPGEFQFARSLAFRKDEGGPRTLVNLFYQDTFMRWLISSDVRTALAATQFRGLASD